MFYNFSNRDKEIFERLYTAVSQHESELTISAGISNDAIMNFYKYAISMTDNIEFNPCYFKIDFGLNRKRIIFEPLFVEKEKYEKQFRNKISEIVSQLQKYAGTMSYDRIRVAYLYILKTVEYGEKKGDMAHNAWGAIMERQAVCEGIAHALAILINGMGIMCAVVNGSARNFCGREEPHSWNMVCLDGEFYHIDATWCLRSFAGTDAGAYNYFMLTDEEIGVDHFWKDYFIPESTSYTYNYFVLNSCFAINKNVCRNILKNQLRNLSGTVYLKLDRRHQEMCRPDYVLNEIGEVLGQTGKFLASIQYSYNDRLNIFYGIYHIGG